ncbi:S41 family peptidase [Sphingomonas sp. ASV193]|uniref:S41 family peptidase n=1 Tax=Sphingomonas sp. ASV193 TaxID=3144405 RepID=UPI0032E860A0
MASDIEILRAALMLHPGLYRYNTPGQIEAALVRLRSDFARSADLASRYLTLARFLSQIRCGHTYLNFFNQSKAVAVELFDRPTRLPFEFVWLDSSMVVTRDPSGALPAGSVITALNGRSPKTLLRDLVPLVRADGHNDAKRISLLEVQGTEHIETFDVFQGLVAPPPGGIHRISAILPSGAIKTFEMPGIGLAARKAQMPLSAATTPIAALWTWNVRDDGIAVLTMPTWATYQSKWDWRSWLSERLDHIDGARGLIVDIRANEGGEDCGDEVLARLISKPYVPPQLQQRLRFTRTPRSLDPYLDTWDNSFRTLGVGGKALENGFILRPGGEAQLSIEPKGKRLDVPVRVLISPVNSSATFQFAQNFRAVGGGKLVGLPTGGNRRGINGGCFFFVRLPASGLEFDLPLVGQFPTVPQPDAGLLPDISVQRTRLDIASGKDATLIRAIDSVSV